MRPVSLYKCYMPAYALNLDLSGIDRVLKDDVSGN